ncbi:phosphate signaling complex protein PhoU [bacterium]|nr:phosphate signaling complex protein PhoU [bacterium]
MSKRLTRVITRIKEKTLSYGRMSQEAMEKALLALLDGDPLAYETIRQDEVELDAIEVEIEESILGAIALHQPVADDLRLLAALLKITNDLERIGDYAVKVAKRAQSIDPLLLATIRPHFEELGDRSIQMLKDALLALSAGDGALAQRVRDADDEVDDLNKDIIQNLLEAGDEDVSSVVYLISVSRRFERAADHATNIAEDVLYWLEGRIMRHGESS